MKKLHAPDYLHIYNMQIIRRVKFFHSNKLGA